MAKKNTKKTAARKSAKSARSTKKAKPSTRVMSALNEAKPVAAGKPADLESLITVLRDKEKPIEVRFAALQSLGAARFASPDFPSIQGDYTAALREVATDADAEMRRRALGILSREKDAWALKKLV